MFEIIPSPGTENRNWQEIESKIELVKSFAPAIHIDVVDGKFAPASTSQGGPNTTFANPLPFKKYSQDLLLEVHLMTDDPIQYLKPFAEAGFRRFIGHVEKMPDQAEFVAQGQLLGEVGLAIDGPTDLSAVKVPYADLDCVLIMTIKAGQSGQELVPEYLKKVEMLKRAKYPEGIQHDPSTSSGLAIEIDGGINDQTILLAKNAGANRFVTTSFVFNSQNPQGQYDLLKNKIK